MSLDEISKLSDDELRVKVAELCGWNLRRCKYHGMKTWHSPDGFCADGSHPRCLPDFVGDLNAMHEAEGTLTDEKAAVFEGYLYRVCGVKPTTIFASETRKIYSATARQRAIAFIVAKEGVR